MRPSVIRTVFAGIAGGVAMNFIMLLTLRFVGFGWRGNDILLTIKRQRDDLVIAS
jgi:hypothetical protein